MKRASPRLAAALLSLAVACSDASTDPVAAPTPTSVVVSASSLSFSSLGETAQLTATVHDQNGQVIAGATVAWVSAHPSVATVDGNGLVSAVGNGATNITATAGTTASASLAVTVEQVANSIVLSSPPDSVAVGDSVRMTAEVLDGLGQPIVGVILEWSSSDTSVVTVDREGWVRAMGAGSAEIAAAAGTTATATATIMSVQVPSTIVLSSPPDSVAVGDSVRMTAEVLDGLGHPITWSGRRVGARRPSRVNRIGHEVSVAAGTAASAVATVKAVQVPNTIVLTAPADSIAVGDSIRMTAETFDALGSPIANVPFQWSSSNTTVATVDQRGWVRARADGSTVITVTLGNLSASRSLVTYRDQDDRDERAALEAFYHATNGPNWKNDTNWLTDKPLGEWYGVTTDDAGRVITLHLHQNGLRGQLPAELAQLKNLSALLLWGEWEKGLTGPIPPELGQLTNLTNLDLGNNQLTGPIPPELANLASLMYLTLDQNKLTGAIPRGLGRLTRLERLGLSANRLTGEIPPEIGNLTRLTRLSLYANELSGPIPSELGGLTNLDFLSLSENPLTGEIPRQIGNLRKLEWLSISLTELTGPIPPELGRLSRLELLSLLGNSLTGAVPPELGSLRNLEILNLSDNDLSGPISPELGNLSRLKFLSLSRNPLTAATIPPELGRLTQLERLALHRTRMGGPIPPELGNLANLWELYLGGEVSEVTGRIPPELGNLGNLQRLWIRSDALTGPIPPELGKLANLRTLYLGGYGISGSIPPEFWNLGKLEWLGLEKTGLTGSIPPEIGNLANLESLQLAQAPGDFGRKGAAFTGPIPPELGQLTNLEVIVIGQHALSGPLPPELGNLPKLEKLIVAQWQGDQSREGIGLTGAIPPELGQLTRLGELWLNANQLSGAVPPELGNLAGLRKLVLDHNDLEGRVPDTFLNLHLDEFRWDNNSLCLPSAPAFRAWRGRIQTAVGPYCAAGAAATADGVFHIRGPPVSIEPVAPCAEPSGYRITESGESEPTGFMTWTGPDGEVTRDPRIGCTYVPRDRPWR